jgi:outer membrane protein TolC
MRYVFTRALLALACLAAAAPVARAQATSASSQPAGANVRHLSVDEAVKLALENNLGIHIERVNPQIQDVSISLARSLWAPTVTTSVNNNSQNSPPTSVFSGSQTKVTDGRFTGQLGVSQVLPTGANYSVSWNSYRATSTNIFNNFDPLLSSNVALSATQPLLKNFKIDSVRQQLAVSKKDREAADIDLEATVAVTARNVKNAYWDLRYQIANYQAQQQSLDLAKRLLADNEKRVQIGTMAPIDIVEAQSEVARNEEAVIVADSAIQQAQDRLRTLIFDASTPDFWNIVVDPSDPVPFQAIEVDTEGAVRRALERRTDMRSAKNSLARTDVNITYFRNQSLPEVNAQVSYTSNAVGGIVREPLTSFPIGGGTTSRAILSERGFGSVLGDVFSSAYPTWAIGVSVAYPIGTSSADANLARTRLQYSQQQTQVKTLELQITTQVRDAARAVTTNQKRVDSARAARELAERRLEAEEKKFAAGIQISFFVFQAQRDLATARTAELKAIADYVKSVVDFEAVQESPLSGGVGLTTPVVTSTAR